MGREARIGLLLGASACLLAVLVDWVVEELHEPEEARSAMPAPEPVADETEEPQNTVPL